VLEVALHEITIEARQEAVDKIGQLAARTVTGRTAGPGQHVPDESFVAPAIVVPGPACHVTASAP
jgi:hypothetical protein